MLWPLDELLQVQAVRAPARRASAQLVLHVFPRRPATNPLPLWKPMSEPIAKLAVQHIRDDPFETGASALVSRHACRPAPEVVSY